MAETTVIHTRISNELDEFIEVQANTTRFHNKAHVVAVALEELKEKLQ
jgi:Arc/MetJ-type ribon-helix-helix transcriptional regulator